MDPKRTETGTLARRVLCGATLHIAQRGPYLWEEFDLGLVGDAFSRMRDAGLELVRLPLVWECFQPRPLRISTTALHHLVEVLDRAASVHLAVLPCLFVGPWMGESFLPPWAVGPPGLPGKPVYSGGRRRELPRLALWSGPELLDAQRLLLSELTGAAAGHPALWGWEAAATPERAFGAAAAPLRCSWIRRHAEFLAERSGGLTVGASLDAADVPTLGPEIAASVDWIGIVPPAQPPAWSAGVLDSHLMPYLASLLHWLSGRRAVVHVLGVPSRPATDEHLEPALEALPTEEAVAGAAERLLELLPLADIEAVVAEVWADAGPKLAALPPFDRSQQEGLRGLMRADAKPKPVLGAFSGWISESSSRRLQPTDVPEAAPAGPSVQELLDRMGVSEPRPEGPRSSLLALPGGEDFEKLARELGLTDKPAPPPPGRHRGAAPPWADVEPEEVERGPEEHVPRLYRRYRDTLA